MKRIPEHIYQAAITRRANTEESLEETIDYFRRHFGGIEIPKTTLYNRCKKAFGTNTAQNGTFGTQTGTAENGVFSDSFGATMQTNENAVIERENAIPNNSEQEKSRSIFRSVLAGMVLFFSRHFSRMDFVFYVATATACYSFWHISPGVPGATFAALYWLLAFDALQRVKAAKENEVLAKAAQNRVWGLEVFAAVAHWNLINGYLWRNLEKLPFEVVARPHGGIWEIDYTGAKLNIIWQNGEWVSVVAAILSCSICAAVIIAVGTTFSVSKK